MTNSSRRGFTLIETLIVVALVLILGSIALLNLGPRKKVREFASTVQRIVHTLDTARNKSINFEGGDKWFLVLKKKSCPAWNNLPAGEGLAVYFKSVPPVATAVLDSLFIFPPTVSFFEPLTFSGSSPCPSDRYIYFDAVTGKPRDNSPGLSFSFKVYLVADPSVSSTISLSSVGLISYTTSSLWSF